jgi:competence protein ComEC
VAVVRLPLIILIVLACGPAAAQDLVTPADRVTTHVNIRSTANEEAAAIGQLQIGEALPLVSSVPRWYEVQLAGGQTGFVSKSWTRVSRGLAPREQDELRIHFLNIGAGSCAIVECPGSNAPPMIVDCGSTGATSNDLDTQSTRDYIQTILGQHTIASNVVLSHPDLDHYSRIASVLDGIAVASVWQGGDPSNYTSGNFPAWLSEQESNGVAIHRNLAPDFHNNRQPVSDQLSCGTASTFILTANTGASNNAQSLVLMIEHEDFTVIFTGDAEGPTESQAMTNFQNAVKATVLTSSHHGASTFASNSQQWADAAAPEVLISSAGNRFFHPRCAAIERFTWLAATPMHEVRCGTSSSYITSRTNRAHYVTEMNGAIIVTSSGSSPFTVHCTRTVAQCGVQVTH